LFELFGGRVRRLEVGLKAGIKKGSAVFLVLFGLVGI
jgi:hypothetical protein